MVIQFFNSLKSINWNLLLLPIIFLISCNSDIYKKKDLSKTDFVYLEGKHFKIKDKTFFPIMLNYVVCFRNIENEYLLSPIKEYENPEIFETNTKDSLETQIRGHLQLIKEMGFNSIRLVFDRVSCDNLKYYYSADNQDLYLKKDFESIFSGLEKFLKIVAEYDIKVMLLIKAPIENIDLEKFTERLLHKFQNNACIFAYDFFNEPLYFDNADKIPDKMFREKNDAFKIVKKWKKMMTEYAPNQLFTIGFSEPIEVFEWDPSILPVDFIAFHTYHPLRVPNEIYWYSKYTNKPWMIGETALPADGDSISYDEQRQFMKEVYKRVIDCGGSGLAWWQFQDMIAGNMEAKYTGIIDHKGSTKTKDGKYTILGSIKPAAKEIAGFKKYKAKPATRMANYYNMLGYNNFVLCGKIINSLNDKPIEGAVIRGWNENWSVGMNTFTNEKGQFTLYSNDICVHFEISAPGMSRKTLNLTVDYYPTYNHNIKLKDIPNKELEYHQISYKSFLKVHNFSVDTNNNDSFIFKFDSTLFNKSYFQGRLGIIRLEKL
ncbi:MAG: hypothetical protein HXX18_03255 [Bacteroidetes bacterium]|nr:hypothetical protein [Bacteroidota bacterium]